MPSVPSGISRTGRSRRLAEVLASGFLAVAVAAARDGRAATFVVDSTIDDVDALPGDGACSTAAGACTLRAAVQEANALPGLDDLLLPAGTYVLSIPGSPEDLAATGDLDVLDAISITGAGAALTTIDAGRIDSMFGIEYEASFEGLTLTGGMSPWAGGAIVFSPSLGSGPLRITDCVFVGNEAPLYGGALVVFGGEVEIAGSQFVQNRTPGPSGESGGAIEILEDARVSIDDCTFIGNESNGKGGAIAIGYDFGRIGNEVVLRRVTIMDCRAAESGGAIYVAGQSRSTLSVVDSVVYGNHADGVGGGLHVEGGFGAILINATLSGNSATRGGGIAAEAFFESVEILNSTIVLNDAVIGAGIDTQRSAVVRLGRSVLSDSISGPDCSGAVVSLGHNLFGSPAPCTITGDTSTDLFGVSPLLGPLQDNGGPTLTHALLPASPAIDSAADSCVDDLGAPLAADQRGQPRPVDGDGDGVPGCDIGAFEFGCGTDADGDTLGDACDCAPADPGSMRLPVEADLRVGKSGASGDVIVTWSDLASEAGTGTLFDVASESVLALRGRRVADGPCVATGVVDPWTDARGAIDDGWYYLVRGVNACGPPPGAGWGRDSRGTPRPACP